MKKDKGFICDKHGKELVKLSAKKILRVVKNCGACWANFREGRNEMCAGHNKNFEEWEALHIARFRQACEDCAAVSE